jgi:hypothetical protein
MSKKTSGVLGLLMILWLGTAGVGSWLINQQAIQLDAMHQDQQKMTLQIADLNDRLVATVRQKTDPLMNATPANFSSTQASSALMYKIIRQGLALAQTALAHDQPSVALTLLMQTEQRLKTSEASVLAPALTNGLIRQIQLDSARLRQLGDKQHQARQQLDVALSRVQRLLSMTATNGPSLAPTLPTNEPVLPIQPVLPSLWQRLQHLVQIEPAQTGVQASIAIRALTCHQVALTLGQARLAIQQQQLDQAQGLIREAQQQIHTLPDANARQIDQLLLTLLVMPAPSPLQIDALALLPEQAP